jgi:hypothetical protein
MYSNSTHKEMRNTCDICEVNNKSKRVTYWPKNCIKFGCTQMGHHDYFVCNECEASGKKLFCEKCEKFANLRTSVREKLDMIFSVNILVCEECHKKKNEILVIFVKKV